MMVAVKTIKKYKSEQEISDFLHEMRITMDLMHPNIIQLYGIVDEGKINITKLISVVTFLYFLCIFSYLAELPWLILQYFSIMVT